jgi:hypothetical protein
MASAAVVTSGLIFKGGPVIILKSSGLRRLPDHKSFAANSHSQA